jgi:DNA polymerase
MDTELLRKLGDELRLLQAEGVESISLSDEMLSVLEKQQPTKQKAAKERDTPGQAPQSSIAKSDPEPLKIPEGGSSKTNASQNQKSAKVDESLLPIPEIELPEGTKPEKWEWLRDRVLNCPVCRDHLNPGRKVVFGVGSLDADIFFCGEAPGADEETLGEPFVGKAGELLTGMIRAMGLQRESVYIGNIMNWRPQTGNAFGNRPPTEEEMAFCLPYLKAQIDVVQPKVIVAMGGTAVKGILGIDTRGKMGQLRGKWKEFQKTPLMITYHPSFLLHQDSVSSKRKVWEDLLAVMDKLGMEITEKQKNYFLAALKRS